MAGHNKGKVGGMCASLPVNRQAFLDPYNFASAAKVARLKVGAGCRSNPNL
jgi:hypothetical protein